MSHPNVVSDVLALSDLMKNATYLFVAVLFLAGILVIYLLWQFALRAGNQSGLTGIGQFDLHQLENLDQALNEYDLTIVQLEKKAQKDKLTGKEREALGRAYFGNGVVLFVRKETTAARERIGQARQYLDITRSDMVRALTTAYASRNDTSDQAIDFYLIFLQLPLGQADPATVTSVVTLLEGICRLNESESPEELQRKLYFNSLLANLPGTEPRLMIITEDEPVRRYALPETTTRIGRAEDNDIVLSEEMVSRHHAVLTFEDGIYSVSDAGSKGGTFVGTPKVERPTPLTDADRIRCGTTVLVFYDEARALDEDLVWTHRNLGVGLLAQKKHTLALEKLQETIAANPDDANTCHYLGRVYQAMGNYQDAFTSYARALQICDTQHQTHFWWARALVEQAQASSLPDSSEKWQSWIAEALEHVRAASELDPQNDQYFHKKAKVLLLIAQEEEAIMAIQAAIALNEDNVDYHLLLMHIAERQQNDALARSAAEAVLARDKFNREANLFLGNAAYEGEDYSKAVIHLERLRALEIKVGDSSYTTTPDFAYRFGRSLFEVGKYLTASRVLSPIAKQSSDAMLYGARCHSRTGRFESAARILRSLLRRFGEVPEARYYLASTLGNLGEYDSAIEEATCSARSEHWKAKSLCLSARLLMRAGRLNEAAEHLTKATELTPTSEEVYFEKGRLACVHGEFSVAQKAFQQALCESPSDAQSHLWLGRTLVAQEKVDLARRHFKLALASSSQCTCSREEAKALVADVYYHLGRVAHAEGTYEQAAKDFSEARKHSCAAQTLSLELANCYVEMGRYPDAFAELSSLSTSHPTNSSIAYNLAAVSCRIAQDRIKIQRYDEAIPFLQEAAKNFKAVNANEQLQETKETLAETYFRLGIQYLSTGNGRLQQSISAFEKARSLKGSDKHFTYYHGVAHFKNGNFQQASSLFEQAAEGDNDTRAMKAWAHALEQADQSDEAKTLWNRLIDQTKAQSLDRIDAMLGLAGLYSRSGDRQQATDVLQDVLANSAVEKHNAYQDLCRLAVSYLCLSGNHEAAEKIIAQHTQGGFAEGADIYLAAILAQGNELDGALKYLERAIDAGKVTSEGWELYEAICRTLAARKVLKDDIKGAVLYIRRVAKHKKKVTPETKRFVETLKVTLSVGKWDADKDAQAALAAYEKATKAHPNNPKILQNVAILNHQLAVQFEESENFFAADRHWLRATQLWKKIIANDEFWRSFIDSLNEGRGRRDQLSHEDVPRVIDHIEHRLAQIHAAFATLYATKSRNLNRLARHLQAAKEWNEDKEFRHKLAEDILREVALAPTAQDAEQRIALLELIGKELKWDSEGFDMQTANLRTNAAVEALCQENITDFQRHMEHLGQTGLADQNMRKMVSSAVRADHDFVRDVVRNTVRLFIQDNVSIKNPIAKNLLLAVVLHLCFLWDNTSFYQKDMFRMQLDNIIKGVIDKIGRAVIDKKMRNQS